LSTDTQDTEAIARGVFAEIAQRFPSLKMDEKQGEPVEISITMPVQPGLSHKVWLCLQNRDELGFSAGHFYCEWFPCTKPDRVQKYLDAVTASCQANTEFLSTTWGRDATGPNFRSLRETAGATLLAGPRFGFRYLSRRQPKCCVMSKSPPKEKANEISLTGLY
jgi:hypothetical protein